MPTVPRRVMPRVVVAMMATTVTAKQPVKKSHPVFSSS